MQPEKMVWVYDGTIDQFAYYEFDDFTGSTHNSDGCASCHGDGVIADTRAAAHMNDWEPIPGSSNCYVCHDGSDAEAPVVVNVEDSLHVNLGGYVTILADRGVALTGTVGNRFDEQCTKCHVANDETGTSAACGFCHVSVPAVAGGGFLKGHNFRKTPDMERNCTACHGSRIKDEFFGLNQGLIDSNATVHISAQLDTSGLIQPDVHFALAQSINSDGYEVGCTLCHSGDEMHGAGATGAENRYDVLSGPLCVDCHTPSGGLHTAKHLSAMACQVCHAQPYKNCFGCHTDVDTGGTDLPFYTINEGSQSGSNEALMTFRIGANLNAARAYTYAVLRHVPVDMDTFAYSGAAFADSLIPNMTAAPTWKYASPHNIVLKTPIQSCTNCHDFGGGTNYADFWLTDALTDAQGWLPVAYESDEAIANSTAVVETTP